MSRPGHKKVLKPNFQPFVSRKIPESVNQSRPEVDLDRVAVLAELTGGWSYKCQYTSTAAVALWVEQPLRGPSKEVQVSD